MESEEQKGNSRRGENLSRVGLSLLGCGGGGIRQRGPGGNCVM